MLPLVMLSVTRFRLLLCGVLCLALEHFLGNHPSSVVAALVSMCAVRDGSQAPKQLSKAAKKKEKKRKAEEAAAAAAGPAGVTQDEGEHACDMLCAYGGPFWVCAWCSPCRLRDRSSELWTLPWIVGLPLGCRLHMPAHANSD